LIRAPSSIRTLRVCLATLGDMPLDPFPSLDALCVSGGSDMRIIGPFVRRTFFFKTIQIYFFSCGQPLRGINGISLPSLLLQSLTNLKYHKVTFTENYVQASLTLPRGIWRLRRSLADLGQRRKAPVRPPPRR
jgi:hypothetical protein